MNNYGSTWKKWDLHIHSPYSALNNLFSGTTIDEKWEKYISKIETLTDISVLGITDYFSIDGYKKAFEYKTKGRMQNIDLLLPNLELRILPVTEQNKAINLHLIFSPEIINEIDTLFFTNLETRFQNNSYKCIKSDLIRLGRAFSGNPNLDEQPAYEKGIEQFKTTIEDINEILSKNIILKNNSIVGVANHSTDGNSGIKESSLTLTRNEIYRSADVIFSATPNDREYFLGKRSDSPEIIISKYGSLKPCIHGSDAHGLEKICRPDKQRFTWIKAEPTFEGLKQICYEPEIRVCIQETKPIDPPLRIDKVVLDFPTDTFMDDNDKFCFSGKHEILFNPNFNCIIGGRGTGKSTIINLMHRKVKQHQNLFFKEHTLTDENSDLIDIDNSVFIENSFDDKYIEFISQNEVEEFAKDYHKLTEAIYNRILKTDENDEILTHEQNLTSILISIEDNIQDILLLDNKRYELNSLRREHDMNKKIIDSFSSDEYKIITESIKSISLRLSEIEESENVFSSFFSELRDITNKYRINELNNIYDKTRSDIIELIDTTLDEINESNFSEINQQQENYLKTLATEKEKLNKYLKEKGLTEENLKDISNAQIKQNRIETNIKNLNSEITNISEKIDKFNTLKIIEASKNYVIKLNEKIKPLSDSLENLNTILVKPISLNYEFDNEEAINQIFIKFEIIFKEMINELGGKFSYIKEYMLRANPLEIDDYEKFLNKIKDNKSTFNKNESIILEIFKNENHFIIYKLLIQRYLLDSAQFKKILVKYDNRLLENSSFGQRCTAALVILLLMGNSPIIIDEPEAHLDSLLISNYLVEIIKKSKINRQIIFATHNANFVVNGDADLIHILSINTDNKTEIISTTIENKRTRESLISLEGGEEAFYLREHRYSFSLK